MKSAKRILGILTILLFLLGLVFKYMLWQGGSVLITASLPVFICGYLPMNYLLHRRKATRLSEQLYLVMQFITYSLVLTSSAMTIQHWAGGDFMLMVSACLVFCMILFYAYLRIRKQKRFPSDLNDIVVASLLLGIFFYISNPRASYRILEGQGLVLDQYEKQNAGIQSAIDTMDLKQNELIRMRQQQELQSLQMEQTDAVLKQRKTMIISAFAGIAFVLSLLVISTRAFYLKRRDNKRLASQQKEIVSMNQELNRRNEEIMAHQDEIEAQRDMVYKQKELIEKSHGEISSSIDYARRLQTSILPSPGLLRTRIKDHFVFFRPKHRVSGDFYWWTQIEDQVVIAVADCTGHGVPGAFMSMLGVSMLREIVSKEYISHPGVVLRRLRKEVMHALKQTGELGEQKDGMDMALVSINVQTLECQYAGANNPLYLVREGELTEYKADRMPIAIHQNMSKFNMHEIQLQKGDHLYLFSDGYVDQFGGPDDRKFKFTRFRQLLVDHATLPMKNQRQVLEDTFLEWKGDGDQIDDIVVIGLEI